MNDDFTYVVLSAGWDGLPVAYKLQQEGCTVVVGQVQDLAAELNADEEKPEDEESRLKQYDGMLQKTTARKLVDALIKIDDNEKENYFIFCDQNNLFPYAQELLDAGYTKGLFPLEKDFEFEKDRNMAMEFVKQHYPDVSIIPFEEFDTVKEAVAFLKGAQKVYVIQSKGDHVSTMVPQSDDIDTERDQMIGQLEKYVSEYEEGGIILKEKLSRPVEITPQMVFWNGKPVFTDLDIETKNIGVGENNGPQVGCGSNLIIRTDIGDRINQIAFPQDVYDMAAARTGIMVWDISLYITEDGIYFGEFCPNRFGYDAIMSEIAMSGGAKDFFEGIMAAQNPLKEQFGAAVRLFNLNKSADREIITEDPCIFLFEAYSDEGKVLSLGYCWDLGVAAAAGKTINEAVEKTYDAIKNLSFKELYYKSMNDFFDVYPTSIIFRFDAVNHQLFHAPDFMPTDDRLEYARATSAYESKVNTIKQETAKELDTIKSQLWSILNEEEKY